MASSIKNIFVSTKDKDYNIHIGRSILSEVDLGSMLLSKDRAAFVISSRVLNLHKEYINKSLIKKNNFDIIEMEDGEENKNYYHAEKFFNRLLNSGYSRKSIIVGIGGGVVGDFSGYLASIYMRGIPVIHIPTTLLAMVDSSIGGKVAVNISSGKNIIGAFYQPEMVISDVSFLDTLPDPELKNGMAETVKHALIGEKALLEILLHNDLQSVKRSDIIEEIVYLSAGFKANIVGKDEKESGLRSILNYGHTVGHAIESVMEYKIPHGEAVAVGLMVETEISRRLGFINDDEAEICAELLGRYELIYGNHRFDPHELVNHMRYDKKNFDGNINFVLLKGLGCPVYNQRVNADILLDVIKNKLG